jgi:hypothetical protein
VEETELRDTGSKQDKASREQSRSKRGSTGNRSDQCQRTDNRCQRATNQSSRSIDATNILFHILLWVAVGKTIMRLHHNNRSGRQL